MHMKVLRTRRAVRGIHMKIGQKARCNCKRSTSYCGWNIERERRCNSRRIRNSKLTNELNRARQIIRTLEAKYSFDDIVGNSDETTAAIEQAKLGRIHQQQCCYAGVRDR